MKREIDLKEISDGKLYGLNDMVKAGCDDCRGCSACCRGMGNSIILDPLDIHRMNVHLSRTFEELLQDKIELNVVDGVILPNLKMDGPLEACSFLDPKGRCGIHPFRPGICRIFPLGRVYEGQSFRYFLQIHECKKENKTKVKVRKWIDTPDAKRNEQFILEWHGFLNDLQDMVKKAGDADQVKRLNLLVLKQFYMTPYGEEDFYSQFSRRLEELKQSIC